MSLPITVEENAMMKLISTTFLFLCLTTATIAHAQSPDATAKDTAQPARFHHVHLNITDPSRTVAYYTRIHGAVRTKYRNKVDALFTERSFILWNLVKEQPPAAVKSGLWHIGWGGRDVPAEYEWFKKNKLAKIHTELYPLNNIWVTYLSGPDDERIEVNTMGHNRFGHVHLLAKDVNATTAWYGKYLGLNIRRPNVPKPPDLQAVRAWSSGFRCDNVSFVVYGIPDYTPSPPWWPDEPLMEPTTSKGRVIDHIAFSYRDIVPVYQRMKEQGASIVSAIAVDEHFGHRSFFVEAPDGVLIEIVEDKPLPEGIWE
jgi:catechol 2,3-dioxygenase-like lactoylglutathione lyase family enzyme